jgi:DNA-binding IclR family transcriptional regulator
MEHRGEGFKDTERYHIRATLRALDVLESFSAERPTLSLTEVGQAIGLNASTTFRLLATLESRGYVEQDASTGRYRVGVAVLGPTSTFLAHLNVRERVYPFLAELRDKCRETVHLTVLDHRLMEVIYLEKLEGLQPIGLMSSRVGGRSPAYCTAVGKALLAFQDLSTVRSFFSKNGMQRFTANTITSVEELAKELRSVGAQGYAIDNAEHEDDVMCVAVPLWNHQDAAVAAISVSGPVERMSRAIGDGHLIQDLLQVGRSASRQLGHPVSENRV